MSPITEWSILRLLAVAQVIISRLLDLEFNRSLSYFVVNKLVSSWNEKNLRFQLIFGVDCYEPSQNGCDFDFPQRHQEKFFFSVRCTLNGFLSKITPFSAWFWELPRCSVAFFGNWLLQYSLTLAALRKMLKFVRIIEFILEEMRLWLKWCRKSFLRQFLGSIRLFCLRKFLLLSTSLLKKTMEEKLLHPNLLHNSELLSMIKEVRWRRWRLTIIE